jgi:hypothetical protein
MLRRNDFWLRNGWKQGRVGLRMRRDVARAAPQARPFKSDATRTLRPRSFAIGSPTRQRYLRCRSGSLAPISAYSSHASGPASRRSVTFLTNAGRASMSEVNGRVRISERVWRVAPADWVVDCLRFTAPERTHGILVVLRQAVPSSSSELHLLVSLRGGMLRPGTDYVVIARRLGMMQKSSVSA